MVSHSQPVEPRTIAKCTSRKKKTSIGVRAREQPMKQSVGWHNQRRLDFQSRQPNASLSNLVLHQQGQPTCAARTLQHGQTDLPLGSHDRRIWPTPSAPPRKRLGFIERQGPGRCITIHLLVSTTNVGV